MKLLWLAAAGALGVLARYGFSVAVQGWLSGRDPRGPVALWLGTSFPLGTLLINVSGAFLLSFLTTLVLAGRLSADMRLIWGTGFCGGYTTFSTFEVEAEQLMARQEWSLASAYVLGNLVFGFIAVLLGRALAIRLAGPSAAVR